MDTMSVCLIILHYRDQQGQRNHPLVGRSLHSTCTHMQLHNRAAAAQDEKENMASGGVQNHGTQTVSEKERGSKPHPVVGVSLHDILRN